MSGHSLALPVIAHKADGQVRRLGVEIEFGGLPLERTAAILNAEIGGEIRRRGRYELEIVGDPMGPWGVELDASILKEWGRRQRDESSLADHLEQLAEDAFRAAAEQVVPVEVVGPPIPMDRLEVVNRVIARLREAGARGTGERPTDAFGMQLNPELPNMDVATIRRYLQAFLCLEDWLRARTEVDLTRRITLFADPFPNAYVRQVVEPDYMPSQDGLIEDYLEASPTRNRSLDLLPLFVHLDEPRVRAVVEDELIKPRPTLHYRLPNSHIDRPGWDLHEPWTDWLVVERLAADSPRLAELCGIYRGFLERPFKRLTGDWAEDSARWLRDQDIL